MTPTEKSQLHVALLQVLRAAGDLGRPEERLVTDMRMAGFAAITLPELQEELRALADKEGGAWVLPEASPFGGVRWAATAKGLRKLTEAGL